MVSERPRAAADGIATRPIGAGRFHLLMGVAVHRPAKLPAKRPLFLGAALMATALAFAACGSSSSSKTTGVPKGQSEAKLAKYAGTAAVPPKPAPGLPLKDYLGNPLTVSSLRGKAVLVTFIYTHCPDVCPLIVSHLHAAQDRLGAEAKKLQIIAVSVDPRGDTPKTVAAFLKAHQMTGRMRYLIGSRPQLERVWPAWFIVSKSDPKRPELVAHSALVYGISGSGKITTLYPASFAPQQIVHDVPILASQ
jgi:protein SCO1/2